MVMKGNEAVHLGQADHAKGVFCDCSSHPGLNDLKYTFYSPKYVCNCMYTCTQYYASYMEKFRETWAIPSLTKGAQVCTCHKILQTINLMLSEYDVANGLINILTFNTGPKNPAALQLRQLQCTPHISWSITYITTNHIFNHIF